MQKAPRFSINSDQCEILLAFEAAGSLQKLADSLGKDVSVVSRQLQKIAETLPVIEKQNGRWQLNDIGKSINNWTREAMDRQNQVLQEKQQIRIASTREFSARVLAPQLNQLQAFDQNTEIVIIACELGVEQALLQGQADIGFDCGRPEDPLLKFEMIQKESFSVVASKTFLRKHKILKYRDILKSPHVQYLRSNTANLLKLNRPIQDVYAASNDIAVVRNACVASFGWGILPSYAVREELEQKKLVKVSGWNIADTKFGIWWPRGRVSLQAWVDHCRSWLEKQDLYVAN